MFNVILLIISFSIVLGMSCGKNVQALVFFYWCVQVIRYLTEVVK